jgi:glycerophosphoryl diester phosphodiesterase
VGGHETGRQATGPGMNASWLLRRPGAPPLVLAHRGGRGPWRENTLAAFRGALAQGADGVELDVRLSLDGVPMVHHDAVVVPGIHIGATRAATLPHWVPTLAEALECCEGRVVNVELKIDDAGSVSELAEAVAALLARPDDRIVVSSFWPEALEAVAAVGVAVPVALLVHPASDATIALERAAAMGCGALHPHVSALAPELVDQAHRAGLAVTCWTADDEADFDRALAVGVDGLVTDEVVAALRACGSE